jgi:hypothetical protein
MWRCQAYSLIALMRKLISEKYILMTASNIKYTHSHFATLLQPCYNLVTSQPCYNLVATLLQPCYNFVTTLLQPCYNLATTLCTVKYTSDTRLLQLCNNLVTSLWQPWDKLVTKALPFPHGNRWKPMQRMSTCGEWFKIVCNRSTISQGRIYMHWEMYDLANYADNQFQ